MQRGQQQGMPCQGHIMHTTAVAVRSYVHTVSKHAHGDFSTQTKLAQQQHNTVLVHQHGQPAAHNKPAIPLPPHIQRPPSLAAPWPSRNKNALSCASSPPTILAFTCLLTAAAALLRCALRPQPRHPHIIHQPQTHVGVWVIACWHRCCC